MSLEVPHLHQRKVGAFYLASYDSDGNVLYLHSEHKSPLYPNKDVSVFHDSMKRFKPELTSSMERRGYTQMDSHPVTIVENPLMFWVSGKHAYVWTRMNGIDVKMKDRGGYDPYNSTDVRQVKDFRNFLDVLEEALEEISYLWLPQKQVVQPSPRFADPNIHTGT